MGCEHKKLELKRYNPNGQLVEWYECKQCHKMFNTSEVQAL